MDDRVWLLALAFAVAFVGICLWYLFRRSRVADALGSAPCVDIGALREGATARVQGTLEAHEGDVLVAPVSGRRCAAYEVVVEEQREPKRHEAEWGGGPLWRPLVEEKRAVPFEVGDATGRVLVRPTRLELGTRTEWKADPSNLPPGTAERLDALLARHRVARRSPGSLVQYRERAIAFGDTVAVLGQARLERRSPPEGDRGGEDRHQQRLVIEPPAGAALRMSNERSALDADRPNAPAASLGWEDRPPSGGRGGDGDGEGSARRAK